MHEVIQLFRPRKEIRVIELGKNESYRMRMSYCGKTQVEANTSYTQNSMNKSKKIKSFPE